MVDDSPVALRRALRGMLRRARDYQRVKCVKHAYRELRSGGTPVDLSIWSAQTMCGIDPPEEEPEYSWS